MSFVNISSGPGKFGILDAFMHALDKEHPHTVSFTMDVKEKGGDFVGKIKLLISVVGVKYCNDDDDKVYILGKIKNRDDLKGQNLKFKKGKQEIIIKNYAQWIISKETITIWYNTQTREGVIDLSDQ